MAEWKIHIPFTYLGVNNYYSNKKAPYDRDNSSLPLPNKTYKHVEDLCEHLRSIVPPEFLRACHSTPYTWAEIISDIADKQGLWIFREYVFSCALLFLAQTLLNKLPTTISILKGVSRPVPEKFVMSDHTFTIVGSSELTSDIDITIQGPHASFVISCIEDLFEYITLYENIPIRCWDVEFYGDFKLLTKHFVNVAKFNVEQKRTLLKYAIVSYFRSTQQTHVISKLCSALVSAAIKSLSLPTSDHSTIVDSAIDYWKHSAPDGVLNREIFYKELATVETLSNNIEYDCEHPSCFRRIIPNYEESSIAFALFEGIAKGNIHRAESYVLPSTAVHVVEYGQMERVIQSESPLPESWISSNARIGIDSYSYILSAIEQLGYLEHYHPPGVSCSKKGVKYFGRLIQALNATSLFGDVNKFINISKELSDYRSGKINACRFDIHVLTADILTTITHPPFSRKGGHKRRRRKTLQRRRGSKRFTRRR